MILIISATITISAQSDAAAMGDLTTALWQAAREDDTAKVLSLLDQEVDIEARDNNGRTALMLATRHSAIKAARVLIEAGADVNAMDDIQDSPYLYAGAEGPIEILRMTLENGADLSSINRYGGTALIPAAHHGHVEIVRELLKTKIDIDHVNHLGWTALLEAVILGDGGQVYIEIVSLLVKAGADISIADNEGISPLSHAQSRGYAEIEKILKRH